MKDGNLPVEIAWQGKWMVANRQGRWEWVSRARDVRAVAILAIDADNHVLLVDQYRVPLGGRCLELPAGLVGDEFVHEHYSEAAQRELEEETGYTCDKIEEIGEFRTSPGMLNESFTLVRATGLRRVGDGGGTDAEDIIVHRVPMSGISDFVQEKREQGLEIDVKLLPLLACSIILS